LENSTCANVIIGAVFLFALCLGSPSSGAAKDDALQQEAPTVFKNVVECRKITDASQRLICYDANVEKLEQAQSSKDLYVIDKAQAKQSRKGLFGFQLPKIKIFGDDDDKDEIKEIDSTIAAMRQGKGGWTFTLEDGATWQQTDGIYIGTSPKIGRKIHIKRAALGSYMGKVEGGVAFRIVRQNR
jgi:hypothetical protein